MSIILDALKKSDNERRRTQRPGISDLPSATPRASVPGWALATMGALAALVMVLALAWWHGAGAPLPAGDTPPVAQPAVPPAPAPVREPVAPPSAEQRVRPLEREPQGAGRSAPADRPPGMTEPARSEPSSPDGGTRVAAAPLPAPSPPAADTGATGDSAGASSADRNLPLAADLMLDGELSLPQLHMELHVYSSDPTRRVVFINGQRLREGDELRTGPRLVEILADGAVLSHDGRRFVLPRD